jgi:hypothetical protein
MYKNGTGPAANTVETAHRRLWRHCRRFLTGAPQIGTVVYTGTGNGVLVTVDTAALAPPEIWTIAMTSATAFSVTGSISGAQAAGTTGTNYTSNTPAGRFTFRINVGGVAFIAGDNFVVPVGVTSGSLTVDFIPGRTITRGSGSFVTDLFEVGDTVVVAGAADAANNATFTLAAVTALVLTVNEDLTTAAADAGVTIIETVTSGSLTVDFDNAAETATRASGSFITDGFKVGGSVVIAGAVDAGNNGTKTLTGVSALVLTFTGGDITDDETGDAGVTFIQTVTSGSLTVDFKTANTVNRSSGSFVTDGFLAGQSVVVTGAVDGGNNATFVVSRVGALELKFTTTVLAETGDAGVLISETRAGFDSWIIDRYDPFSADLETIMHGQGLAGADAVYIGLRVQETPASTIYTWETYGMTGYAAGNSLTTQPGVSPDTFTAFHPTADSFWLVWNGRRFIVVSRASTTYHTLYAGFFLPYSLPSEYPYPMYVAGDNAASHAHTSAVTATAAFYDPQAGNLRLVGGTWDTIDNDAASDNVPYVWPYDTESTARAWIDAVEVTVAGEYVLYPCILYMNGTAASAPNNVEPFGALDGVFGGGFFGGAAEEITVVDGVDHLLVQNIFRTDRANFCALRLA